MDIKILLSIYNKPWLIEPAAGIQLLDAWQKIKSGEIKTLETGQESRQNSNSKFFNLSGVRVAPANTWDMRDFKGFAGAKVAVIPVQGALMRADYCGALGTATLMNLTQQAIDTPSVNTIVYVMDSPGGTASGNESFSNLIRSTSKRTVCMVDELMCSAAYWIGSACDEIYASSSTAVIGSIGTMCTLYDDTAAMEKEGVVLREYYATESKDKNAMITEAVKGNGEKLVKEMLDPMNNIFLSSVRQNRGAKLNEGTLTGKTYLAQEAINVGLIDGIKTITEVLQTKNTNKMTSAEYKMQFPAAYAEILNEGRQAERDRVASWNAWRDVDPESVDKGIADGTEFGGRQVSEFSAKAANNARASAVVADSPAPIPHATPTAVRTEAEIAADAEEAELMAAINKKYNIK
jgi:ClpP class serine protease